jgi:EamA domain-containing membrane protein RarD
VRQVAFGCIWAALAIFSVDALRRYRAAGVAAR